MFDKKQGSIIAKCAYELIVLNLVPLPSVNILMKIWHSNIPQKIKCFIWLAYNKKLNTWDNLLKKGSYGLDHYCLCKSDSEMGDHLFAGCPFLLEVLHCLDCSFNIQLVWFDLTLSGNLSKSLMGGGDLLYLPIFLLWNLWKTRNSIIF